MPLGDDSIEVGRVLRTHGIDGELLVLSSHDDPSALLRAPRVLLDSEPGVIPYRVAEAHPLGLQPPGVRVRLRLLGLDTRERAQAWVGATVRLEPALVASLAQGDIYAVDLIGMTCVTTTGRMLGVVREIWPTAICDQLLIVDGRESRFVPARDDVLVRVDAEARRIEIDLGPLGLEDESP